MLKVIAKILYTVIQRSGTLKEFEEAQTIIARLVDSLRLLFRTRYWRTMLSKLGHQKQLNEKKSTVDECEVRPSRRRNMIGLSARRFAERNSGEHDTD